MDENEKKQYTNPIHSTSTLTHYTNPQQKHLFNETANLHSYTYIL